MDLSAIYSFNEDMVDDWICRDSQGNYFIQHNGLTFRSVFQPIVDNETNIYGFEGLVRIYDACGNSISPYHFFKSIEESNYESVLATIICAKIHLYNFSNSKLCDKKIFLNVTPSVFSILVSDDAAIKKHLMRLKSFAILPEQVVWEIMEFKDSDTVTIINGIKVLKRHGIQVAMDDYGAEYSSERRAKALLPSIVKLDKSLLDDLMSGKSEPMRNAVQVCRSIGAKVIAEGIEDENGYKMLQTIGVDFFQGYYLGRPGSISHTCFL